MTEILQAIAAETGVGLFTASVIHDLREGKHWTQEKEDHIIGCCKGGGLPIPFKRDFILCLDREGKRLPMSKEKPSDKKKGLSELIEEVARPTPEQQERWPSPAQGEISKLTHKTFTEYMDSLNNGTENIPFIGEPYTLPEGVAAPRPVGKSVPAGKPKKTTENKSTPELLSSICCEPFATQLIHSFEFLVGEVLGNPDRVVVLTHPDPGYTIGTNNPAIGTKHATVGRVLQKEGIQVRWANGTQNAYKLDELSVINVDLLTQCGYTDARELNAGLIASHQTKPRIQREVYKFREDFSRKVCDRRVFYKPDENKSG